MPRFALPAVAGGEIQVGGSGRWQLVVVYRGKHCPKCKAYLGQLEALKADFAKVDTEIVTLSCDPREKAEATAEEWQVTLPLGYDLSIAQARDLGLYVSEPRSAQETDRPFAEPGLFVVNPEGKAQIIDISNAPFARPDLAQIAGAIGFIQDKGYPIRGTG
ncbi:MAG: redoxin domain-containing protein [Kiloniellales bacterium]|nr:redoxin domain-containing protein [Kiloniellales bacterium]